jgi:hypothetical protein
MDEVFLKDEIKVTLQLTVSQSWCLAPTGDRKKFLFSVLNAAVIQTVGFTMRRLLVSPLS